LKKNLKSHHHLRQFFTGHPGGGEGSDLLSLRRMEMRSDTVSTSSSLWEVKRCVPFAAHLANGGEETLDLLGDELLP
jgi:hypothetical protein